MSDATKLYKVIKAIQGIILIFLGVVFCIFYQDAKFYSALGYCVGSAVLVYSILTICFAFLFQRGVASFDMIGGALLASISVLLFVYPAIVTQYLPFLSGLIMIMYSLILFIETMIYAVNKNYKKMVLYMLVALLFAGMGITVIILSNFSKDNENMQNIIVLIVGIVVILLGLFATIFSLIAPTRKVVLSEKTLVKTEKIEDSKSLQNIEKPSKTPTKNKKSHQKEESKDEVLKIEEKEKTED